MATYQRMGKNPVRLGTLGVMKKQQFELTSKQESEPRIKRQIEAGLIEKVSGSKEVKTKEPLTAEIVATLTGPQLDKTYNAEEIKTYAKDIVEGSDSMSKKDIIAELKKEEAGD